MIVSDNQEQLDDAHNSNDNFAVAVQLEKSDAAEDNTKAITPCSASIGILMDQSAYCNEQSPHAKAAMPLSKKKLNLKTPNGNGMQSRPSKKLKGDAVEDPLALQLKKTVESSILEKFHELTTPKTEGTQTRCSKKPMIDDQPSAKTGSLSTRKTVVS